MDLVNTWQKIIDITAHTVYGEIQSFVLTFSIVRSQDDFVVILSADLSRSLIFEADADRRRSSTPCDGDTVFLSAIAHRDRTALHRNDGQHLSIIAVEQPDICIYSLLFQNVPAVITLHRVHFVVKVCYPRRRSVLTGIAVSAIVYRCHAKLTCYNLLSHFIEL